MLRYFSALVCLLLTIPGAALAQVAAPPVSEQPNLSGSIVALAVPAAVLFGVAALMKPYKGGGWPWALVLLGLTVVALSTFQGGGAALGVHVPSWVLVTLPLAAILGWPTWWAAAVACFLLCALIVASAGRTVSVAEIPLEFLLLIGAYALIAFGLVAVRRRRTPEHA